MNGSAHFEREPQPRPGQTCPDCGREGPHAPIPGRPGKVECSVCFASWEPDESRTEAGPFAAAGAPADRGYAVTGIAPGMTMRELGCGGAR